MTEQQKDFERVQKDSWFAKSVGCPGQSKIRRFNRDTIEYVIVRQECSLTGGICEFEKCVFAHWGLV